jgi:choline dehydrogenase-like flavoprotein
MSYFEFPQLRKSKAEFIKKVDKTLIFKINIDMSLDLLLFYEKLIKEMLQMLKLNKNFSSFKEDNTFSEFIYRDSNHHFGGTRQGNNPEKSVVDKHGRMHFTDGIYFAGTSVLPVSRSEHPTMLAAFLALRSVEHIESSLNHE